MSARIVRTTIRRNDDHGATEAPLDNQFEEGDPVVIVDAATWERVRDLLGRLGRDVPKLIQPSRLERDAYALLAETDEEAT